MNRLNSFAQSYLMVEQSVLVSEIQPSRVLNNKIDSAAAAKPDGSTDRQPTLSGHCLSLGFG